jgi:hypothetical protein
MRKTAAATYWEHMPGGELNEVLVELVSLVASLEEEVRSLEVLTTYRIDHSVTEKLGIPRKSNALHLQVQSLREKGSNFPE